MNSIKLSLLVFYLTVFISSSDSNLEGNPQNLFHFNIEQVSSVLYEKENNQEIIFLVPNFFIKPSNLKEIILKKEGKNELYPLNLKCDIKIDISIYSYIKCQIDLSEISHGFYRIISFSYDNKKYINKPLIPFVILKNDDKPKDIDLTNVLANVTEYMDNQFIKLIFANSINIIPQLIKHIEIENNNEHYNIKLNCNNKLKDNSINCLGDFKEVKANKYIIKKLNYNNKDINIMKEISF